MEPNDWLAFDASWIARARDGSITVAPTVIQDLTQRYPFYDICAFATVGAGAEDSLAVGSVDSTGPRTSTPTPGSSARATSSASRRATSISR